MSRFERWQLISLPPVLEEDHSWFGGLEISAKLEKIKPPYRDYLHQTRRLYALMRHKWDFDITDECYDSDDRFRIWNGILTEPNIVEWMAENVEGEVLITSDYIHDVNKCRVWFSREIDATMFKLKFAYTGADVEEERV